MSELSGEHHDDAVLALDPDLRPGETTDQRAARLASAQISATLAVAVALSDLHGMFADMISDAGMLRVVTRTPDDL